MPRRLRHTVPGHLHEATLKTFQGRFQLVPGRKQNRLTIGALAYSQQKYNMRICNAACMSNHLHLLYVPDSAEQARDFFRLANSQISLEAGKLCGWRGGIFKERYKSTVVTEEPEAQCARMAYIFSQGVKEGLVKRPEDWPGVNCVKAWTSGSMELEGDWIDRTAFDKAWREFDRYQARRKRLRSQGRDCGPRVPRPRLKDFTTVLKLKLSRPPAWADWTSQQLVDKANALRQEILDAHEDQRARVRPGWKRRLTDRRLRGYRPPKTKKSREPRVHAASTEQWLVFIKNWEFWLTQYTKASARLKKGIMEALYEFPEDSFLPLSLVPGGAIKRLGRPG